MKLKNTLLMMLILIVSASYVGAQDKTTAVEPLERVTLEDFEMAEDWKAKSTSPLGETKTLKMIQRGLIKDVFDEKSTPDAYDVKTGSYSDAKQEERIGKNHILGVKTYFANRGFDRVEVAPPQEFIIKGKARQVSVWVLGRKYRHTLFAKFRDYKGNTHNIRLGRLDFFGWRKLTAPIPGFVPQSTRFSVLDKNIRFVSLFVTSDVNDLEIRTDKQESLYPGFEVKDNW